MYKTIVIDDIFGISTLITEQRYRNDLDRFRSLHIYRGMSNADYRMMPSLKRVCKEKSQYLEPVILSNFTKYAVLQDPAIENNVWKQMILGQHHGLPTRLLDWSFSPLVAMHFALSELNLENMDKNDCVVWRVDIDELHSMLPEKYQKVMQKENTTIFSLKMLEKACTSTEDYDKDMEDKAMLIVEPPSIDQRIMTQFSFFSIIPSGMHDIESFLKQYTDNTVRYIIKKEIRWQARDLLDQLNISERMVYPGLDGLSKWLERHYYVKGSGEL